MPILLSEVASVGVVTEVANYAALPAPNTVSQQNYLCLASQGTSWLPGAIGGTYYPRGYYYSDGTQWIYNENPFNASQADVDAGIIIDQFVSPNTLKNASQWGTKEPIITAGIAGQYWRYDKTFQTLDTSVVPENGNLYFTNARAIVSTLTGYTSNAGVISSADTILEAIQKLNGNISGLSAYTFSTGLTNTTGTITNNLSTGIAGGQTLIGGTGVGDIITYKATTGNGTPTVGSHVFTGGNNGATTIMSMYNNGNVNIGNAATTNQRLIRIGQDTATIDIGSLVGTPAQGALYLTKATPSATNYSLSADSSGNTYVNAESGFTLQLRTNNITRVDIGGTFMNFTSGAASTTALVPYTFTTPASTNQTLSTETIGFRVNMSASIQHATGAITTQRDFVIDARTHTAVGASTITTAATLAISAAPIAGTNTTITNGYALWLQSGGLLISSGIISVVATSTLATGGSFSTSNSSLTGGNSQNSSGSNFVHTGSGFNTSVYYGLSIQNRSSGALAAGMGVGLLMGLGYGGGSFINTRITSYAIGAVSSSLDSAFGIQTAIGGTVAERFTFYKESFGINTTTPNSYLNVNGSVAFAYVAKTASYTLTAADYTVNCTSNSFNLTLPTAVGCTGRIYNLKNSGTGLITILTTSSQTIDGNASGILVLVQRDNLTVQSDGANWIIL